MSREITLTVNGQVHRLDLEPDTPLLYVLRNDLGLKAAKYGCGTGQCGACTVLVDGQARPSCRLPVASVQGREITTLEGLMDGENLGPVQQAFLERDAFQCGYCTPGQIMSAEGLLRRNPAPELDEIRVAMSGNLCRCGAYEHIFQAVGRAAELRRGK